MSHKADTFLPPWRREASVARKVTREVAKSPSHFPPAYQAPAQASGMPIAGTRRPLEGAKASRGDGVKPPTPSTDLQRAQSVDPHERLECPVQVNLNLTQAVALVSAALSASDSALVSAARWETLSDNTRAKQLYARSVMLEDLANQIAQATRNA